MGSGVVRGGSWYSSAIATPYYRVGCGAPDPHLVSISNPISSWNQPVTAAGADRMIKHLVHRTWRLALTVGPLVAIALSLAAGLKWR